MGTRNLTCVVLNGEYKIAQYGQWDGYPSGQGLVALRFLRHGLNRDLFVSKVRALKHTTESELATEWEIAGAEPNSDWVSTEVSQAFYGMFPHHHRDTGAAILALVQAGRDGLSVTREIDFAADGLFCEWCYVVDLDKNTFEVFKGFTKTPPDKNDPRERFAHLTLPDREPDGAHYFPVRFVASFPLDSLPSDDEFVTMLGEKYIEPTTVKVRPLVPARQRYVVERNDVAEDVWKVYSFHASLLAAVRRLARAYRGMKRICGQDAWNASWRVIDREENKMYDRISALDIADMASRLGRD